MKGADNQNLGDIPQASLYRSKLNSYLSKTENPSNYTILVVDSHRPTRELIRLYLKTLGYNVFLAETGAEALEIVKTYPLDLVFLEAILPTMDGLTVCAAIRKYSEIPIIILTALGKLHSAARAFQVGADGCITKPFTLSTLNLRMQGLLHHDPEQI